VGGLAREGTELYAVDYGTGHVSVLDIAQPGRARVVGQLTDPGLVGFGHLAVNNAVLYLSGGKINNGFATVDVSDPTRPAVLGRPLPPPTFDTSGGVALDGAGVAVVGNVFALAGGFSVFDVTDPSNTNAFLFQIGTETNNRPFAIAVSGGFAFAAARSTSSTDTIFDVVNFESGGTPRHPSTVTLTTPVADQDPNSPGLQVAEGTAIPIRAAIVSDRPVRQADLLLNGRVVQTARAAPFDNFQAVPIIAADGPTATFRVRVTDMAGFSFISDPFAAGLLPVTVAPAVVSINPADGVQVAQGQQAVRIAFSQALAPATVTGQTFRLLGPGGQPVPIVNLQLRGQGMAVQLAYDQLPPGSYQLVISGAAVTNVAGVPLGTADVISHFTVAGNTRPGPLFPDPLFAVPRNRFTANVPNNPIAADVNGDGQADLVNFKDDLGNLSVLLSRGDSSFAPPIDFALNLPAASPAGSTLLFVAAAGLNGDGRADVVSVWQLAGSQTLTAIVLLSKGDGTFASRSDYALSLPLGANIALADVTGDGRPDLVLEQDVLIAYPQTGAHFLVLPGNADGTFGAPIESTVDGALGGLYHSRVFFAVADVDGDGRADVVSLDFSASSALAVLFSNGDGTFGRRQQSPLSTQFLVSQALVSTPGHVQLVASFESSDVPPVDSVSVFPVNTDGSLGGRRDVFVAPPGIATITAVFPADVNGDGRADLVLPGFLGSAGEFTGSGTHLTVLFQNADGTFAPGDDFALDYGATVATLADVDGDGRPDVILVNGHVLVNGGPTPDLGYVLLNDGHGHFLHQTNYQIGPPKSGLDQRSFALGDLNGDGKLDVVAGSSSLEPVGYDYRLSVQLGNGDGTFQPGADVPLENSAAIVQQLPYVLADVYGNGKLDVVTATGFLENNVVSEGISILPGSGDGTFGTATNLVVNIPGLSGVVPLAVGDLNGDGHSDLITLTTTASLPSINRILVLYGQADGTFFWDTPSPFLVTFPPGTGPASLTLADVDRDGTADLVFLTTSADLTTVASVVLGDRRLGNSGSGFTPTRLDFPLASSTDLHQPQFLQVADVDGDGHLDLVVVEQLSTPSPGSISPGFQITVLPGNGDGTFGTVIESTFLVNPPSLDGNLGLTALAVGDVTGDGVVDVVIARSQTNSVLVFSGNGDGTFRSLGDFAVGEDPVALRLGDLNNDGALDFVTANTGGNATGFPTISPRLNRRP
jgi:hypothetical protein